jgi:hypothetical protein
VVYINCLSEFFKKDTFYIKGFISVRSVSWKKRIVAPLARFEKSPKYRNLGTEAYLRFWRVSDLQDYFIPYISF